MTPLELPPESLLMERSDPEARAVLEDWCLSRALRPLRLGVVLDADAAADAAAADDDDDAADDDDDDDAADDDAADDDAADDADDADDDADADDDDGRRKRRLLTSILVEDGDMTNGLKLILVPGAWYGRAVLRLGWLRRVRGDEFFLEVPRSVWRVGAGIGLDKLQTQGPGKAYRVGDPGAGEELHRLVWRRCLPAPLEVWAKHCPMPPGWESRP